MHADLVTLTLTGLGFGVAEACIEHGFSKIFLSSSQQSRVDGAIAKLKKSYPSTSADIIGLPCDLGTEDTLESNIQDLFSKVGTVDHIIFTAGDRLASKPLSEVDFPFIKKAGMVRFFAPLLVGKYGPKHLSGGPTSSITLTTGGVSEHPIPNWSVVGSYATGLQGMTRQLALDLKPIRVNIISPGAVDTELWDHMSAGQKSAMMEGFSKSCATGKVGQVEDVVESYLYCMRDHNLTGSMISTNGGHLIM